MDKKEQGICTCLDLSVVKHERFRYEYLRAVTSGTATVSARELAALQHGKPIRVGVASCMDPAEMGPVFVHILTAVPDVSPSLMCRRHRHGPGGSSS